MRWVRASFAVLAALVLAPGADAQIPSPSGNVHGTVLDEQRQPIAGAAVTLRGPDALRNTTTDTSGDFRFLDLPPGTYALELDRPGFESARRELAVQVGKNTVLEVMMPVAGAKEDVTVVGEPSFDNRKVETGATQDAPELRAIPTTRDPWAVLRQVPGVLLAQMDVGSGHSALQIPFVGKGSHGDQNDFNSDGTTVSIGGYSPILFDFDSLESIAVTTGGSDPSLSSPGVTVNLVTKRGTNRIAGSARALYTDGAQWDYGLEVGGPLWKDRVWIWGAVARNSFVADTFFLPDGESVRSQETDRPANAKLTAQLVPANALTLAYVGYQRSVSGRGAGPQRSQPTTLDVDFPGESYRAEDSHVFSEKLFAALKFAYVPVHRDALPQGGLDAQADADADYVWRNSYLVEYRRRPQHQIGATASAFFDTGSLRHELRFGFGYRHARLESASVWPADQLVGNAFFGQASVTRATNAKFFDNFYDTYLSDTIQAGDLTLNLGARFDYQQTRNLPSSVSANPAFPQLLPAVDFGGDAGYPLTWRSAEPRIGATYALGRERRTLLRASYARFANELSLEGSHVNAFPGVAALYYAWNDANRNGRVEPSEIDLSELQGRANVNPDDPGSAAPVNRIAADLAPPVTDELIVGIERQLSSELSISLAYTHRRLHGPLFTPQIGVTRASYQYLGNATGTIRDPATGLVLDFSEPYYGLTADPPPTGAELRNRPDTAEIYDGVELQLLKTFSNGWMLRASFAYNNWRQRVGAAGIVDPNNVTPGSNASGPIVDGNINATWQFNVSGIATLPLGIQAGWNFFGRQGFPIPYFVDAETNDATGARPSLQIGSAAAFRTPNVYQLDLQLSRDFVIASTVTITPTFDCFNVLNSRTVLGRDGSVGYFNADNSPALEPNPAFNAVVDTLGTRTIRGGVRISF